MFDIEKFKTRMSEIVEPLDLQVAQAGEQIKQVVMEEFLSKMKWPTIDLWEKARNCWLECNCSEVHQYLYNNRKPDGTFDPMFWHLEQVLSFLKSFKLFRGLVDHENQIMAFVINEGMATHATDLAITSEGKLVKWWKSDEDPNIDYFSPIERDENIQWYKNYPDIWSTLGIQLSANPEIFGISPAALDKVEESIKVIRSKASEQTLLHSLD